MKTRRFIAACAAACTVVLCGTTAAHAAPQVQPLDSADAIAAATERADATDDQRLITRSSATFAAAENSSTMSMLTAPGGQRLGGSLAAGGSPRSATASPNGILFRDVAPATDSAVQKTESGMRLLAVIKDQSAPLDFRFDLALPAGSGLHAQPDGSVQIRGRDGAVIGGIDRAWAFDARGQAVPTRYSVDGDTLVQRVDHRNAAYPVVADPSIDFGETSADITLLPEDQRIILSGGGTAAGGLLGALICSGSGPGAALCAVGGATIGTIVFEAIKEYAVEDNCNLVVTVTYAVPPAVSGVAKVCS